MNKVGRNDPCPCGSGKKHKQCCLQKNPQAFPLGKMAAAPAIIEQSLQTALGLQQTGLLRQAEAIYHEVLKAMPDHPDALHLLGLLARQEGKHGLAIELIAKAASINPVAPVYFNLGNAYQAVGKLDKAIESFCRALAIKPDYVAALNNLGTAFRLQGDLEAAIDCFQDALKLQPDHAELHSNLGDALRENHQAAAALEHIQKAIALNPDSSNAHLNLGKVFAEQGHFSAAGTHIERAIRIAPNNPDAWASIPFTRKMSPADGAWLQKSLTLLQADIKPHEQIFLNYALGKYFDDMGDYETAFAHYARANEMQKRINHKFDREAMHKWVDSIISRNPQGEARHHPEHSSTSPRPTFIVGMPRSGTSLMEQILASHRHVFGAGELPFWSKKYNSHATSPEWPCNATAIKEASTEYETVLDGYSTTALRIVDKMPTNFFHLGLMHASFPNARIIHMQRNPIDTCLSIYFQYLSKQHGYTNDLEDLAFYYREYQRLMDHWRGILPPDRLLEVPYEGLIEDQEIWSRRIIDFIGLDWDENCLEFHKTDRKVGTASNWQVRQKIYKTSKERWRNYEQFIAPLLPLLES